MTILEAAKKGAEWMRWWLDHSECDCETGHSCGQTERRNELAEIERAIKTEEVKVHGSSAPQTCSICGRQDMSVMKPVIITGYDGLLCHKCDRR